MTDHVTIIRSSLIDSVARECGASGLVVYVYLCRRADSTGRSFPSYNTIAEDTGISRSSAIRYAKLLIEHGYLRQERRTSGSLVWVITGVTVTPPESPRSVTVTTESVTVTPGSVTVTPEVNTTKKRKTITPSTPSETPGFDEFWRLYPRRSAKVDALKAWRSMGCEDKAGDVVSGLKRYVFSDDPKYIPYPATWLRGERWTDEPVVTEDTGIKRGGRYLAG